MSKPPVELAADIKRRADTWATWRARFAAASNGDAAYGRAASRASVIAEEELYSAIDAMQQGGEA